MMAEAEGKVILRERGSLSLLEKLYERGGREFLSFSDFLVRGD